MQPDTITDVNRIGDREILQVYRSPLAQRGLTDHIVPPKQDQGVIENVQTQQAVVLVCFYLALAVAMSQSSAFAADFPVGSYVAHKGITLTFDDKGQFRVLDGKTTQVTGNYRVKADQLELTDTGGPWACTKNGEQDPARTAGNTIIQY